MRSRAALSSSLTLGIGSTIGPAEEACSLRSVSVTTASAVADPASDRVKTNQVIVLFGATGDLAKRKLLPGMFHLSQVGLMPEGFRIIGAARHPISTDEFRALGRESVQDSGRKSDADGALDKFAGALSFVGVGDGFEDLGKAGEAARDELGGGGGLLF